MIDIENLIGRVWELEGKYDQLLREDSYKVDYDKLLPAGQVYVSGLRLKLDFMK